MRKIILLLLSLSNGAAFAEVTLKMAPLPDGRGNTETYYNDGRPIAKKSLDAAGNVLTQTGSIPDGPVKVYDKDHVAMALTYKNGVANGAGKSYYPSGKLYGEQNWLNGKLDGLYTIYRENGSVQSKTYYKKGRREGEAVYYHENGKVKMTTVYKGDVESGRRKTYYDNGVLEGEAQVNGKTMRDVILYDRNGKVIKGR